MHKDHKAEVVNIEFLKEKFYLLQVKIEEKTEFLGLPGQFYELKVPNTQKLRIPISIYNIENQIVSFMIKLVGEGTAALSVLAINSSIQALGPLGNSFTPPKPNEKLLLLSGGVGYAPLNFLKLSYPESNFVWFHGGRDESEVFPADQIYTDDGSKGKKGFVSSELELYLQTHQISRIYTCGPRLMMKSIVEIAESYVKEIDVSLEEYMACGLGVCYGCVTKIKSASGFEYKTVCKDGPIFKGREVIWDE